jgi:hypothetical protein
VETERGRRKWHLSTSFFFHSGACADLATAAYFTQTTVDRLGTVDDIRDVHELEVPPGMFTSTRMGKRRTADSEAASSSQSTVSRVYAAFPSPLPPLAPRPAKPGPSTSTAARASSPPSVRMYEPYSRPESRTRPSQSPTTYYSSREPQSYSHPTPSSSQPPTLHYSYPSPPNNNFTASPPNDPPYNYTRQSGGDYSRSDSRSDIPEHPPAPTLAQPYSSVRVRLHPSVNSRLQQPQPQPQQASGGWITSPMVPYQPRQGSPRSDYTSSSSSSSSYASSPSAPLYPLYSPGPALYDSGSDGPDSRTLPRLQMPVDPAPAILISSVADSELRRGDVGPCRRDLAPLNSLTRLHPYRRDPTDDRALRLLDPRPSP